MHRYLSGFGIIRIANEYTVNQIGAICKKRGVESSFGFLWIVFPAAEALFRIDDPAVWVLFCGFAGHVTKRPPRKRTACSPPAADGIFSPPDLK
jgi:hypothetical protein